MGDCSVTVAISPVADPATLERVDAVVDTGATFSVIPGEVLARLGISPTSELEAVLADGREVSRPYAWVTLAVDGRHTLTLALVGQPGDHPIIGAHALEGLRLGVDPVNKQLIPVKPRLL